MMMLMIKLLLLMMCDMMMMMMMMLLMMMMMIDSRHSDSPTLFSLCSEMGGVATSYPDLMKVCVRKSMTRYKCANISRFYAPLFGRVCSPN